MRKHYLLTGVLLSALLLGSIAGANAPVAANNGVKVQLAMILDGSASIGYANWDIIKEGLASAVENTTCVPQDGSVELTVVQFGYPELAGYAKVEVSPTVIDSQATANAVAAIVRAMPYGNGNTPMAHGIKLAADTVATSTNFDPSLKQALNLFTDGSPNVCCPPWSCPTYKGNVVYVRNYALTTLQMTEDQDEFDAEGIGITTSNHDWLRDSIVWPQPGYDTWPPPGPGWVRVVADAAEFAETICEKFQLIVPPECVLTVESDGCCPIEVAYNGFAANVSAGGGENFTIPCCNNVTLTADDSDDCCDFVNWTGDVPGGTNSTNPITIHIDSSKNVTAHCSTLGPYTLTVTSDGCCPIEVAYNGFAANVSAGGGENFTIPCCNNVTLTADDSDDCCYFVSWTGNVTGAPNTTNPITFHMDSDKAVTTTCANISYNLTVTSDGCCPITVGTLGSVAAGDNETFPDIACCTNVTLTADDSDDCCYFVSWTGNVTGAPNTTNPITIHIDSSKNVTAHCSTPGPYTLKVTSDGCCPITVGTLGSVAAGGNQAFTDIPCCTYVTVTADDNDPSCEFDSWSDGGAKSHSIHMDSDKSVTAYCSAISAPGSLGDTVFYDNNGNGNQDPGEVGIAGVQVNLYKDDGNGLFNPTGGTDDFIGTRTTGGYGIYSFIDLPPFCDMGYWVLILENTLPPSLTLTTGSNPIGPICLEEGGYYDLADFGYQPPVPVGGEVYPVNKLAILMPWITLAALLAGSISWFAPRRREARS